MSKRLYFPATERNREPILNVLKQTLPQEGQFLEIASGSGEHIIHFAKAFPSCAWQPSDLEIESLESIQEWIEFTGATNIKTPVQLNVTQTDWPFEKFDAILCINMIHISPWAASKGLFEKAGQFLNKGGLLYLYGPYKIDGQHTAPSNIEFDLWLKEKNPDFGVRDLETVIELAQVNHLTLKDKINMPANNFSLVFVKN